MTEPALCIWSNALAENRVRMTIPPSIPQPANIFSVNEGSTELNTETTPFKYEYLDAIQIPGIYRLKIGVSAKDWPTELRTYRLKWAKSYYEISISEE
jgi:hypothetical protein